MLSRAHTVVALALDPTSIHPAQGAAETEDPPTMWQTWQKSWDAALEDVLTPLGTLAVPVAIVILALLVLGRLLVPLPRAWPRLHVDRRGPLLLAVVASLILAALCLVAGISGILGGGAAVALLGLTSVVIICAALGLIMMADTRRPGAVFTQPVAVVVGLPGAVAAFMAFVLAFQPKYSSVSLVICGGLASGLAVVLTATEMATRLRMSISVRAADGTERDAAVGRLIALLEELGGQGPAGLEVPRGADSTALTSSVISADPTGAVAKALWTAWHLLVVPVPWRIQVDEEGPDRLNVVITRNGRAESAMVVDRHLLGFDPRDTSAEDGPDPVLYRFVAAAVLLALHRHHAGISGLYGVHQWRSLGYQFEATADGLRSRQEQQVLLSRALTDQPDNPPAQLALQASLFRTSKEADQLEHFADWLTRFAAAVHAREGKKVTPLEVRARNLELAIRINGASALAFTAEDSADSSAPGQGQGTSPAFPAPEKCAADASAPGTSHAAASPLQNLAPQAGLQPALERLEQAHRALVMPVRRGIPTQDAFSQRIAERIAWYRAAINGAALPPDADRTPRNAYSAACYYASIRPDFERAVHYLQIADAAPELHSWRADDPQLAALRESATYLEAFRTPARHDVLELPPMQPYRGALERHGLTTTATLSVFSAAPERLAELVGIPLVAAQEILAAARLGLGLEADLEQEWIVEVMHVLHQRGLLDRTRLAAVGPREMETLSQAVMEAVRARVGVLPEAVREAIPRALGSLRNAPRVGSA